MSFSHMPVLGSQRTATLNPGHSLCFLASMAPAFPRLSGPRHKGPQTLSSLTPCDRGIDRPREGKGSGRVTHQPVWSSGER